ncbi:MAG: helix-turn-helix domain-containing protein [Thermoplasmata archaeon]|nr:helix-turn-helix domain-containing protein [Thermoplasmata archaeon]
MEIGEYLKELRLSRSLTQDELSDSIRVSTSHLSRIESGKLPPSDDLLEKLAPALQVRPEELLLVSGRVPRTWTKVIGTSPADITLKLEEIIAKRQEEERHQKVTLELESDEKSAIEIENGFPFEGLAPIAELESWRKEINRPIYHMHKWWAQRLGSVFRAILVAANSPKNTDVLDYFYRKARVPEIIVYDPFMGSGTTVGEALKLGARAIGRDINPVSYFVVKNAMSTVSIDEAITTFKAVEKDVAERIGSHYKTEDGSDVLYNFWVMVAECPKCGNLVDLFSSRIFSKHAYPSRHPGAKSLCPKCDSIDDVKYQDDQSVCGSCGERYNPLMGNVNRSKATCPDCRTPFSIAGSFRTEKRVPSFRMYAKMVLTEGGKKEYVSINGFDKDLFESACEELGKRENPYPDVPISPGHNTDQVLNYGYTHWFQMFNKRQLLCLSILAERVSRIEDTTQMELFTTLFSGVLEFNNMFTSFKGEGTGAVRHMFAHHILKPERTPLEANLWGTPKSSGSFSTLFRSRILKALEYKENPFELRAIDFKGKTRGQKVYDVSEPIRGPIASSFDEFKERGERLYLSCGDSSKTDIDSGVVDLIVTDPPFFDNVHYSELADFFHIWIRHIVGEEKHPFREPSTRSDEEVQDADPTRFSNSLTKVFIECGRVLKDGGKMIFTYHHSRQEGWEAVLRALLGSGFRIVNVLPTKSEMSVARPKRQAKEPIDLDIIIVCKRTDSKKRSAWNREELKRCIEKAGEQIRRFNRTDRKLSRNDIRVVLMAQIIKSISICCDLEHGLEAVAHVNGEIEDVIEKVYSGQVDHRHSQKKR